MIEIYYIIGVVTCTFLLSVYNMFRLTTPTSLDFDSNDINIEPMSFEDAEERLKEDIGCNFTMLTEYLKQQEDSEKYVKFVETLTDNTICTTNQDDE